ncbi:hypothetical protein UPYG_G00131960 [Umbra pygmaea]|uniref:Uncharacterized protein n=1 Tax=Umbra pygmaea TaxID=75934 RepID=A0ABD0XE56_UMBPY
MRQVESSDQWGNNLSQGGSGDTGSTAEGHWRKKLGQRREAVRQDDPDEDTPSSDLDRETRIEQQALVDKQRHQVAYRCMHHLRDTLYDRYSALLREKVRTQRLEIQRHTEKAKVITHDKPKQNPRKLASSKLCHDNTFLRSLPKSNYYLIQDLQNQLSQRGSLRSLQDCEEFRLAVHNPKFRPAQLEQTVKEFRKMVMDRGSAPDGMSWKQIQMEMAGLSFSNPIIPGGSGHLAQISLTETGRGLIPVKRHSEGGLGETLPERGLVESSGRQQPEQDDTEQLFLKQVKVPRFASLQPGFLKNLNTLTPPVQVVKEIPEKSSKAELIIRRLRHMHTLSLTNMAVTHRLLVDQHKHTLSCSALQRSIQPLSVHTNTAEKKIAALPPLLSHEWARISLCLENPGLKNISLENLGPKNPDQDSPGLRNSGLENCILENPGIESPGLEKCGLELRNITTPGNTEMHISSNTLEPLSFEDIYQRNPSKVIDCGSKLWKNYNWEKMAYCLSSFDLKT